MSERSVAHGHPRPGRLTNELRAEREQGADGKHGAPRPVIAFIDWFWPRFNASAFVLSRAQEYQADAFAARVTSPRSLSTLISHYRPGRRTALAWVSPDGRLHTAVVGLSAGPAG